MLLINVILPSAKLGIIRYLCPTIKGLAEGTHGISLR